MAKNSNNTELLQNPTTSNNIYQKAGVRVFVEELPDGFVSINELLFRFGVAKPTFYLHLEKGLLNKDEDVIGLNTKNEGVIPSPKGVYYRWEAAGKTLLGHLRMEKRRSATKRLELLGFNLDLKPIDPDNGVTRLTNKEMRAYADHLKNNNYGNNEPDPLSIDLGVRVLEPTGVARTKVDYDPSTVQRKPQQFVKSEDFEGETGDEPVMGDGDFHELLQKINYASAADVDDALARIKVRTNFFKAREAESKYAEASNMTMNLKEMGNLLRGAMIAVRTSTSQNAIKVAEDCKGSIVTQIVMADPTLSHIGKFVDSELVAKVVRKSFDDALHELSNLLGAFAEDYESADE